jgi:type II secretion system protein G
MVDFHRPSLQDQTESGEHRRWTRLLWIPVAAAIPVGYLAVHLTARLPEGRRASARVDVQIIANEGIVAFRWKRGRYPTNEEGIQAVIREGFLRPNFDERPRSRDPWGHVYVYERPGRTHPDSCDVCSYGADGSRGGEEEDADLCNE